MLSLELIVGLAVLFGLLVCAMVGTLMAKTQAEAETDVPTRAQTAQ